MSDLAILATRCEAASGSNRELDQDIHEVVVIQSALSGTIYPHSQRYTASVDAAMSLVAPDQTRRVEYHPDLKRAWASVFSGDDGETLGKASARAPPHPVQSAPPPDYALLLRCGSSRCRLAGQAGL